MNKAALKTLSILELIANSAIDISLAEIAKQLNLPKSTTYYILKSLLKKEYVSIKDEKLKTYEIGLGFYRIFNRYQNVKNRTENTHSKYSYKKEEYSDDEAKNFLLSLSNC